MFSLRFLPKSVPTRHLRDTLGSKGFFATSVPNIALSHPLRAGGTTVNWILFALVLGVVLLALGVNLGAVIGLGVRQSKRVWFRYAVLARPGPENPCPKNGARNR